jgi:hypothetical protein
LEALDLTDKWCFILLFSFFFMILRRLFLCADFSEHCVCSIFNGRVNTTDEDGTECSETSAHKVQTLGNYPKEGIQHSQHG